jgi:methylenetetrahydrofolate reductase (NADPH)
MKSGSNLEKILSAGHFAFTGELGPPQGANAEVIRKKASHLKGITDAVNITTKLPSCECQVGVLP